MVGPSPIKAPDRFWYRTERGWTSRPWRKGEREAYMRWLLASLPTTAYAGE